MAQLDDKTLQNLNKRLEEMDRLLATDYQKAMDLGKAFTQGFTTEQIDAFLKKLNTVSRRDAAKLNVALNLVDVNGRPLTLSEVKRRISQIESAINKSQTSTSIRGTRIVGTTAMTNELQRYKDALSILGMSTSQQFDLIRNGVRRVNNETKGVKSNLENMLPTIRRLASAFGVAFSVQGLVNFGKKLVETRGEFELQQVALRSILQNKQLADEIWDKTMKAALQSPFTAMQLTKYTKQLAAYRIETDKLYDTTKRLADVSAGLGVDMQRLILAYGQVKAANYLRASEIRQFTEAGVNVLGELRDYFNDVKGMSVDTAKVMDMVQKRLVTFSDVEAIFKRMTDQGGIFYNMQYVQSQTVKGQINKLHDAYDQMLNSIGKANEGAIKNMVSLLNNIVKNWREWKTVLDTIAWPLMITSVIKFGRGLLTVGSSARIAAGEIKGLELAGTKLRNFIGKTNPWMALATAVTAATFAIINHVKAVRATQKEIDEQNLRLYETKELMSGYQKTLEENNKAIKEGRLSEDELNKKRKENSGIIEKLKEEYPDIVRGLDLERDGTDKLTESLKNHNDELERRMTLQNMLGTGGGLLSDTVRDNMQQWETDLSGLKGQLLSEQSMARGGLMKMELNGKQDSPLYAELKKISELDLSDVIQASKEYEEILDRIFSAPMRDARWDVDPTANYKSKGIDIYGFRLLQLEQFPHDIKQVSKESNIAFNNFITSLEHNFESSVSNIKEYSDKISQEYGNDVLRFIANNTDLINQGVLDGNADVVKTIRTVLQSAGVGLTEESRKFYNQLLNERILYLKYQEALNDAEEKSFFRRTQTAMAALKSYVPIDFFATPASSSTADPTSGTKNNGNKAKESVSAMISLIKEMNSEYSKLSKSAYGFAKSQDKVTDSFRESFEQIFRVRGGKGTYINYDDIDFTNKAGAAKALRGVFEQIENANAWGKFAKNAKDEMLKAISGLEVEADIEVKTRIREDFARQMEEAFGNYELTLDLQKINLPSDAAKDILGFDYTSLNSVLERVRKFRNDLENVVVGKDEKGNDIIENHFDKDDQQAYANWMKKIEDQLFNIRKERAKQYTKYLEQELSERAKLEMQYVKDTAFVEANFKGEQKDAIKQNLQTNYEQALKEFEWKSFKESDFYVEMMQDLTSMPSEYLDLMMQKLNEWAAKADVLSPRALKEVLKARERVMAAQVALSPIRALGQSLGVIRDFQGSGRTDAQGNSISKNIKESREQMQGIIVAREQEILKIKEKLALEEQLAGKIKAQEELQESLNQLTNKGVEGLQMTADAAQDIANIEKSASWYGVMLAGLTAGGGVEQAEGETDADFQTRKRQYEDEVRELRAIIDLLNQLRKRREAASTAGVDPTQDYSAAKMASIRRITELRQQLTEEERKQAKDQGIMKAGYAAWNNAVHGLAGNIKEVTSKAKEMGNQLYETFEVLGVETDVVDEAVKDFGNSLVDVILQAIEMIPSLVTGFTAAGVAINAAMGIIGLIALAIQAVLTLISGLAKIHDAKLERDIQNYQERIDDLTMAYERLEKAIEKTVTTSGYLATYNKQIQNTYQQIAATQAQLAAAQDRKRVDQSEVNGYRSTLNELYDQLEDLQSQMQETFGGIGGESNYRSWAEGFVSEWRNAFLETGDGLDALEDHFDEFLQSWFEKQATMRIAGRMLEPLMSMIDQNVDDGILTRMELDRIKERASEIFPQLNEQLREFYETMGFGDGNGSLSGLAKAISGMSEEQADILAAYGNSIRMYAASIDLNVAAIANALGIGDASPSANPMLQQISIIARNTSSIYTLLDSVVMPGHSKGRSGLKIFLN